MRFPVSALPLKKIRAFILLDVRPSSKAPRGRKGSLFAILFLRNKGPAKRIGTLKGCNDFPGCGLSLSDTRSHTLYLLLDRKSTRLNSSHGYISYAVFCLKKKKNTRPTHTALRPIGIVHTPPRTRSPLSR